MHARPRIIDTAGIDRRDAARYIERLCAELSTLADRSGLTFLSYLLEVAREEATTQAGEVAIPAAMPHPAEARRIARR